MVGRRVRISFAAAMVNALIAGAKTETRRFAVGTNERGQKKEALWFGLPAGTTLLVREPSYREPAEIDPITGTRLVERICYRADAEGLDGRCYLHRHGHGWLDDVTSREAMAVPERGIPWRHPRYMPAWATRLVLTLQDVQRERLNDLTDAAAMAEGATQRDAGWCMDWNGAGRWSRKLGRVLTEADIALPTPRKAFFAYWDYLHTPKGEGASAKPAGDPNPELAVVRFTVERLPHPCWEARS